VALKEYMPSSLATRVGATHVQPRSQRHRDTFEAGLKSFVNEAKLLAQFDHPALVKVYRFWEANGTAYMVMPFYQGVTVKDAIRAMPEPPDEAWLLSLLAPLTEALMVIHAEHCYHRDIAPDNVILLAGSAKPLLLDFGAARRVIGDMTQGLTVILKAGYAPVEQYAEVPGMKQGPWTDVYALAAVVYWAITGSTPPASVGRMMSDSFVPLAKCAAGRYSASFLQTIDRALILRPEHRTQTIEALRQDLGLTGEGAAASPPPMRWDDSDATVIRPVGHKPGPATVARPEPPVATSVPQTSGQPTQAPAQAAAATKTRLPRVALVASTVAAAVVVAGIWWAVQRPSAEPSRAERERANATVPEPAPTATQGVASASGAAVPLDGERPTSPSASVPAAVPPPVAAEAAQPTPAAPIPRIEAVPGTPPEHATEKPKPNPERSSPRVEAGKPERAQADSVRAECGRIFQRLSLGESNPELLDRLKVLKCQ
jgi:hypothetical protein